MSRFSTNPWQVRFATQPIRVSPFRISHQNSSSEKSFYREDAHIENAPFLKHSKVLSSFSDRDKQHISDKPGAAA